MLQLAPTRLFDGERIRAGAGVVVENGRVMEIGEPSPSAIRLDGLLAPGFIDVQVNGGGGALFNDAPTSETLAIIAAAHRRFGVTGVMPTLITDDRPKIAQAFAAVDAALAAGVEGIIGLHLEGPWLSGPRKGVHPAQYLRRFDDADLQLLTAKRAFPLMATVAPEGIDLASVAALARTGVIICIGHTAASAEEVEAALAAGARGFTHLFNAMSQMEGRKPGAVGAALAHRESWAGLILDGIHVHPVSARAALAAKTARRLMLVSDAMATIGGPSSMFLFGERITVSDGALRTADGVLAGAHLELSGAVRNAKSMLGASTEEALRMASLTPAEFLRVDGERGHIAPGARADFVLLGDAMDVRGVWVGGVPLAVHPSTSSG